MYITTKKAAKNLKTWMDESAILYEQKSGNFYISSKTINRFHLAVLPMRDDYMFSQYSISSDEDVIKLRGLLEHNNIFKTYNCTMCPISEPDNAIIISDEQNQMYINPKKSFSANINHKFVGRSGLKYIIAGTVPQYFYKHLLLTSENHIPTYALFLDERVFLDTMYFIKESSLYQKEIIGYFNGNYGSDIFHYHIHLTDQTNNIIDDLIIQGYMRESSKKYNLTINDSGIKIILYIDSDIKLIFENIRNDVIDFLSNPDDPDRTTCASLFFREGKYGVIINIVNTTVLGNQMKYEDNLYRFAPTSYTMIANYNMKIPKNQYEYDNLVEHMKVYCNSLYIDTAGSIGSYQTDLSKLVNYVNIMSQLTNQGDVVKILNNYRIEFIYLFFEAMLTARIITPKFVNALIGILQTNCFSTPCNYMDMGKFKYILGIIFNRHDIGFLFSEHFIDFRLYAEIYYLKSFKDPFKIQTDYLYFRGEFLQKILLKTMKNFIRITKIQCADEIQCIQSPEMDSVNKWLDYKFKRIGEVSASGKNTVSSLKDFISTNVDFVMKIMVGKQYEFIHEFFTSVAVNEIRKLIPNFILCFGGFMCNSSNENMLCNIKEGPWTYTYLLLENVKNSNTLYRNMLSIGSSSNDVFDTINILYQLVVSLSFAWKINNFTHYDLHLANIMQFDFISNPNAITLFKKFDKYQYPLPNCTKIIFRYYFEEMYYILVPVKYLYLIIDYGSAYVNGMPDGTSYIVNERDRRIGMTSDKPNDIVDIYTLFYTFFMQLFTTTKESLSLLASRTTSTTSWNDNSLVHLFYKYIQSYGYLFTISSDEIMSNLLNLVYSSYPNIITKELYNKFFSEFIKPEFNLEHPQYISPSFNRDRIPEDFRGSYAVMEWMKNNFYQDIKIDENTCVFNWGYDVPDDIIRGIQPNIKIQEIKQNYNSRIKRQVDLVKNFMQ